MIEVGDDDLVARAERLTDRKAYQSYEGSGIQAESDLLGPPRVHQRRHRATRTRDRGVHRETLRIAAAALHVVIHQVVVHGIEHELRDLRAGGIVEKYEGAGLLERDELGTQGLHGKLARGGLPRCPCIRVRIHVALRGDPAVILAQ